MLSSESDPPYNRTSDASPGTFHGVSTTQKSPPLGSSDPKRSNSGRHYYESTLKGMEGLNVDNDDRGHY